MVLTLKEWLQYRITESKNKAEELQEQIKMHTVELKIEEEKKTLFEQSLKELGKE